VYAIPQVQQQPPPQAEEQAAGLDDVSLEDLQAQLRAMKS